MAEERESMSPTKIGFGILWPACWTGIPIKAVFVVLAMTMGLVHFEGRFGLACLMLLASPVTVFAAPIIMAVYDTHFGEGIGLPLIFGASIPVDIWALGVVGQTFFLERLRKEPPHDGLGFAIWWRAALIGTFFLPLLWWIVSHVTEIAISASHSMAEMESMRHIFDTGLPVAERIGLELTIWGSISSAVLLTLAVIGVSILGQIIRRMAENARPAPENYQGIITRWDLMRVPADQGLLLATVAGVGVVLSLMFWTILPVTTPHPHECCKKPEVQVAPIFKPVESLNKNAQRIASLAAQVEAMEQQKADTKGQKEKGKGKIEGGTAKDSSAKTKP
jgi:CBS domain-containing protein